METTPQVELPKRLAVILKNVRAVRDLQDYLADEGVVEEDLKKAQDALVKHLRQSLHLPEGWKGPYSGDGARLLPDYRKDLIVLRPEKKWNVPGKGSIAITIFFPSPVGGEDDDASVNLYVPPGKLQKHITDSLLSILPRIQNWDYIRNSPDETASEFPIFKWIRYDHYAGPADFDTDGFFRAVTDAVGELLKVETEIDELFENAKAPTAAPRRKRPVGRATPKRK